MLRFSSSHVLALARRLQAAETLEDALGATRAELDAGARLIRDGPEATLAGASLVRVDERGTVVYLSLAADGEPIGTLAVGPLRSAPTEEDLEHLALAASQLGPALRRIEGLAARHDEAEASALALRRSAARLQVLADTAREFSIATTDLSALLALVAQRLTELVGEGCVIQLLTTDGDSLEAVAIQHRDPSKEAALHQALGDRPHGMGDGIVGRVAVNGEAIFVPATKTPELLALASPEYWALIEQLDISSVLSLPLISRGAVLGVLTLGRSAKDNPFTVDDRLLAQDLTDRAALAIDNARLVSDLEERVAQRTAAVEEADRELEAFSYSLAHDLRGPLRGINGFSTALIEDYGAMLDDVAQGYLKRIAFGAMQMGEIIDAVLALARLSRTALRREIVDLSQVARDIVGELQSTEPRRSVEFVTVEGLVAVGDPQLLRVVLDKLLRNAWKFTGKLAHARIEFGREAGLGDGAFFIRDNGAGFDMAHATKLFRPFQRLHTPDEFEGTGAGLAIVQRIVHRHGGQVWADGIIDGGATFHFTLPGVKR